MTDGLDRAHLSLVNDIECVYDSFLKVLNIILRLKSNSVFELWCAEKKKDLFEKEFGLRIIFKPEYL